MNKKSNKKLMAGLIALITLIIVGITCSGFLDNFKEGIKFLGISLGISAGLVLLLFIMKYIIKGADKLVGEGRTFNDRAIVLFSILILVSLTCRGFLKNFTLGIVFLIVSIAFVAITFLIMYGINSKKGAIKKVILAEKTPGEKMFILLTVLILVSLTCGGFIQNLKAGILFLIISIISSLALYLIVTEVKNENSIIGKIIRIETTFNQKMMILLSTIIMVSLTCGGFLRNLRAGIVFLMISIVFTTSMLMLVLGIKSKHKIYDKIAGFETNFNEKMIILLTTMAMVSITSGGFLYNFKLGMLFLTISLIFSGLVLAGVISVRPRVNIFRMKARIQNLGKREAIRAFGMIFACIFVGTSLSGSLAYFTSGKDIELDIVPLKVNYYGQSDGSSSGSSSEINEFNSNIVNSLYEAQPGDIVIHFLNEYNGQKNSPFQVPYIYVWYTDNNNKEIYPAGPWNVAYDEADDSKTGNQGTKMIREDDRYCWYSYIIKNPKSKNNTVSCIIKCPTYGSDKFNISRLGDETYITNFIYNNSINLANVDKTINIENLSYSANSITHYYIKCTGIQTSQYIYYGENDSRQLTNIYNIGYTTSDSSYDDIFGKVSLESRSMRVFYYYDGTVSGDDLKVEALDAESDANGENIQKLIPVSGTSYASMFKASEIDKWYVSENEVKLGSKKATSSYLKFSNGALELGTVSNVTSKEVTGGNVFVRGTNSYTSVPVNRSLNVYYFSQNDLGTGAKVKASNVKDKSVKSEQELIEMIDMRETGGRWYKSSSEVEVGMLSETKANLVITDSSGNELLSKDDVKVSAVNGDSVYIRSGKVYNTRPSLANRNIKVHYYNENGSNITITTKIDNTEVSQNTITETGKNNWQVTTNLPYNNLFTADEEKLVTITIPGDSTTYTFTSKSSADSDNEVWIKNGKLSQTEIKDSLKLIIKYAKSTGIVSPRLYELGMGGVIKKDTNPTSEDSTYYVFEVEVEADKLNDSIEITNFKIEGNSSIGTSLLHDLPLKAGTYSTNDIINKYVDSGYSGKTYSGNIIITNESNGNKTMVITFVGK